MTRRDKVEWLLRIVLGGIFLFASFDKILHPEAFAEIAANYQLLPGTWVGLLSVVLPWVELVLGILLILGRWSPGTVTLVLTLLGVFWLSLLINLARGLNIQCGCFSTQASEPSSMAWYFLRDTAFLAMGQGLFFLTIQKGTKTT